MSFLIFDVDHSLASIGGDIAAEKVSSIKPIKVTNGSSQVTGVLSSLFTKKEINYEHPLLPGGMKMSVYDKNDLAKNNKLEGFNKRRPQYDDHVAKWMQCKFLALPF